MGERYRLEQQLGTGRAGAVYAAHDTELNRLVAFRRFDTEAANFKNKEWQDSFYEVVSGLSRINHSNILSVLDAGIDKQGPFLVTAHVEGLRLSKILKKQKGAVKLTEIYALTEQCLNALQAAEEYGYFHHALCPSSVIGSPKASGGYHYTLMDLGHSKLLPLIAGGDNMALTKTLDSALMAPEIFEGNPCGIRSSLYMLGQLIYWMTVGGHPLAGLSLGLAHAKHKAGEIPYIRAYRPDLPESFRQWIYWLIQPEIDKRPISVMNAIKYLPSLKEATKAQTFPKPMSIDKNGVLPKFGTESKEA